MKDEAGCLQDATNRCGAMPPPARLICRQWEFRAPVVRNGPLRWIPADGVGGA